MHNPLKAKFFDRETGRPLSYVNIGIPGKDKGTVSTINGDFKLYVTKENIGDSIKFSMIGYHHEIIVIKALESSNGFIKVHLKPIVYQLKEVIVLPKDYKKEVIGKTGKSLFLSIGMGADSLGSEMASSLIKLKHSPVYLESASFDIASNNYQKIKLRLNIYSAKDGRPYLSILPQPIYIETELKKGIWRVNLSECNIQVTDNFFIALEYIENLGYQGLYFHGGWSRSPSFNRTTSQANWKSFGKFMGRNISPTFNVTVSYRK